MKPPTRLTAVVVSGALLYHVQGNAGFGISQQSFYLLAAITIAGLLLASGFVVWIITRIVKSCRAKKSLLPAVQTIICLTFLGLLIKLYNDGSAIPYRNNTSSSNTAAHTTEQALPPPITRDTPTDRIATMKLPSSPRPPPRIHESAGIVPVSGSGKIKSMPDRAD